MSFREPLADSAKSISFTYLGQAPSKSNYRYAGKDRDAKWRRIKVFHSDIGKLAGAGLVGLGVRRKDVLRWPKPRVTIEAYNQRIDAQNAEKATIDAMQHILYETDRGVTVETIPKKDDGEARLVVTVTWEG